ncbi:MAG: glutamate--tRNA ligase family protein [Patescibacteria group bacterium]
MQNSEIIVRFPPSPTGLLHIGNVRTALYNWLFARQNQGKFIIRIEDTDKERSKKEYEEDMLSSLAWLGLNFDNESNILRQSERGEIYKQKIQELIQKGVAYVSKETEGENREVVRFRNPGGKIKFDDLIRGPIEMEVGDLKDFIIARNINEPVYHLAVVVDDLESGVTHVIRGEDHLSNTPRQILILEALGGSRPIYAHLPLILAEDKSKLSKRKHGEAVSLKYYRDKGYGPEAIINFLAMIGWNSGTDQDIFSLEELLKVFDISKVQKKGGIFDQKKLRWTNKEHMKLRLESTNQKIEDKIKEHFSQTNIHPKLIDLVFERIEVISDIDDLVQNGELGYFFNKPDLDGSKIAWKNQSMEDLKRIMNQELRILENPLENVEKVKEELVNLAEKEGKGEVLWPLRYALSGKEKSPDPFTLIDILGIKEGQKRIQDAISKI